MVMVALINTLVFPTLLALASASPQDSTPLPLQQCPLPNSISQPHSQICLKSKSSRLGNATKKVEHPSPPSWVRSKLCTISGKTEYCAFTKPSFSGNEGVSVVTTPERIAKLSKGIFSDKKGQTRLPTHSSASSYEDAEIPGKGIGLIATKPIRAGQRIMTRTPAVMVDRGALDALSEDASIALLVQGVEALPTVHRDRYLNLTTHLDVASRQTRISQIFAVNSFRTGVGDQGTDFHSVFTESKCRGKEKNRPVIPVCKWMYS